MELASVLLTLLIVFVLAMLASVIFERFGIPGLVGEIIIGVLLANIVIGDQSIASMLGILMPNDGEWSTTANILNFLGEVGIMFLLFTVGLETRVKELLKIGKVAFIVALLGVILPLVLGFIYVYFFYDPENLMSSLFLGAAMVATSVGITARVIKDMKLMNARESKIIIGAAVIDDVLGMIVLAIVLGIQKSSEKGGGEIDVMSIVTTIIIAFAFVIIMLLLAGKVAPYLTEKISDYIEKRRAENPNRKRVNVSIFAIAVVICFFFAIVAEEISLASIIGAFFAGMLFSERAEEWKLNENFETVNKLILSFFFVCVGLRVSVGDLKSYVILATIIVLVLAIIGKYVGCGLGSRLGDKTMSFKSMNIIGIGMIPRGEVGIVVATLGLTYVGYQFTNLYTIIILMSVITTIIAPIMLKTAFKKKYGDEIPDRS